MNFCYIKKEAYKRNIETMKTPYLGIYLKNSKNWIPNPT